MALLCEQVIIAAGVIVLVYAVTMLAAYGFAKLHIRGREVYFWLLLACLTLPEVVLLDPAVHDGPDARLLRHLSGRDPAARRTSGAVRGALDPQLHQRHAR